MNWKLRASLILIAFLSAAVWIALPSQADTKSTAKTGNEQTDDKPVKDGDFTKYPNGVYKIEPRAFAVTEPVKNMPEATSDMVGARMRFNDTERAREKVYSAKGGQESQQKGVLDEAEVEINRLNAERVKKIIPGAGAGSEDFIDPLVNKTQFLNQPESPQAMPTPSLTFNGAGQSDNFALFGGGVLPPDTNGDVGPNNYVSSVNLVLKFYDKNGAIVKGPIATNSLFSALPANDPCSTLNDGDKIVLYDSLADRWHISQFGEPSGNVTYQCVALSQTGDPTGAYYVWSYAYPIQAFNDYPKAGVWTDAYHMTFNQFGITSGYLGVGILSQDRPRALAGDPAAGAVYVNLGAIDQSTAGTLPGDIDGYVAPPPGLPEIIGEYRADEFGDPVDGVRIYKWIPNFTNPGSSSLTVLGDVALAPFDARSPDYNGTPDSPIRDQIEQKDGANLDAVSDRSMHRFAYRNFGTSANPVNSYVGNFTVNVSGQAPTTAAAYQTGIRWFEMRRTGDSLSVFDQGTHNLTPGNGASGLNDWMGSIAQDNLGNIALGFSQAGTTQHADIKTAGRTGGHTAAGTLNEGEATFFAAPGAQTSMSGRWGDYSSMSIDPTDDCTFWYTQEYYAVISSGVWSTRVGKFRYPQCTDAPKATIQGTVTFCDNGAPVPNASVVTGDGFNRLTNASGTYSITVSPGTYSLNASKSGGFTPNPSGSQSATVANGGTATANFCLNRVPLITSGVRTISAESCGAANGTPDPGEQATISLPIQNTGSASTSNLTVTLQSTGGVTNLSGTQSYGAIGAGGSATNNFTFKADSTISCGTTLTLTFRLNDGATDYGTITQTYTTGVPTLTFSENFDAVTAPALPAGWTNTKIVGTVINWVTSTTNPNSTPNSAFANDATTRAESALVSPGIAIQQANAQLTFKNRYNIEETYDGVVLEYSTNGGTSWTDILAGGGSFASGGYNSIISSFDGSPIAGRRAWSGISGAGTTPVYIDTVVNLPASLNGQSVKVRWVLATDTGNSTSVTGANIDDVKVFGARACNTCAAGVCTVQRRNDFTNDNKSDYSVFRPSSGVWFILSSGSYNVTAATFGTASDKLQPQDYDSDGKIDLAVFRGGNWYILRSSDGAFVSYQWGVASDIPVAADYTGDGKADVAVYRPSEGAWFILRSDTNTLLGNKWGGDPTDVPVVGDFDGDCKSDLAVRRTVDSPFAGDTTYFIFGSSAGPLSVRWGRSNFLPAIGDYNGDGKADIGVVDPSNYNWYVAGAQQGQLFANIQFGTTGDIVVPADYDGDGKTDLGVYRPSNGYWFNAPITTANPAQNFFSVQFGANGDTPTPRWNQYPLP